jgi:hypothetical protein
MGAVTDSMMGSAGSIEAMGRTSDAGDLGGGSHPIDGEILVRFVDGI